MENASKALIIAGAILISILIIGLGVYFYNMAASAGGKVNLNRQEANAHNQAFTTYFGDRKSSTDVKNLMQEVRSNNITGSTEGETVDITVLFGTTDTLTVTTPSKISALVKAGKTYWVGVLNDNAFSEDDEEDKITSSSAAYYNTGYLRVIAIKEGSAPSEVIGDD